jgi:integrase
MTGTLYRRGRIWWIGYVVNGQQHCESTGATNKRLAQSILNLRIAEIIEGRYRLPKSNPPKLNDWAAQFLETVPHPNTKRTYKSCINLLNKFFGPIPLSQISAERIEQYKAMRTKAGAGPAIINRNLAVLRRMLKLAARQRLIARSPFEEVDFLDERSTRRQAIVLSFADQNRLEIVAPPLLRTLIVLLTETGLRVRKEALPLKWEDVDLQEGVLYVRQSKTPAGKRVVPMTAHCLSMLKEWMKNTGQDFSPFVFANPNRPDIHLKSVRKTWVRALKAANLNKRPIYDLRTTFASRLSAAGTSDNLVAGMLGHSSPSIVSTYAKVVDEFRRSAIQKLEMLRKSQSPQSASPSSQSTENQIRTSDWIN